MDNKENIIENRETLTFKSYLSKLMEQKEIVLLYTDEDDTEDFSSGYIARCTDNEIIMLCLDTCGRYDGVAVKMIEDIIKLEYGGQYSERLKKLNSFKNEMSKFQYIEKDNAFLSVLSYAQVKRKIVKIEILNSENDDVIGYVEEINNNILTVELVDYYGLKDGRAIIDIENINYLECDSEYERARELLVNN